MCLCVYVLVLFHLRSSTQSEATYTERENVKVLSFAKLRKDKPRFDLVETNPHTHTHTNINFICSIVIKVWLWCKIQANKKHVLKRAFNMPPNSPQPIVFELRIREHHLHSQNNQHTSKHPKGVEPKKNNISTTRRNIPIQQYMQKNIYIHTRKTWFLFRI